ncbi:MAG: hypothetical protein NWF04_03415 [Candidatus Bathyarchaeota archaeon]|nr:hypothetical protein [Candidatus Bathyarchaeota archaeon]
MEFEDEFSATTFQIYVYLVRVGQPEGPRDVMRALGISSPGVVHRHLQKLADMDLVGKDAYGRYAVTRKVSFKGYIWVGKYLVATSKLFFLCFAALTISFSIILIYHLAAGSPIDDSFMLLTIVTVAAAALFLIEALRPRTKTYPKPA